MTIDELVEEFDALADWEERCEFLIDLGFENTKLPENEKVEENRVHGCQSNVWLVAKMKPTEPPVLGIVAESDAMIVNGLISILLAMYADRTPDEILATNAEAVFRKLGLDRHLSSARRNGLFGMVKRIRTIAEHSVSR